MPNIDDFLKALRGFIDLIRQHPFFSVPVIAVALILGAASAVKLFREQLAWGVDVMRKGTRRQRSILAISLVGLGCIAIVSPAVVLHYYRPRPVFLDQAPVVLTREFNARWQYSEDHNGNVKYRLTAESGGQQEESFTTIPYHKVGLTGKVTLQVTAIHSNGAKRSSDPFVIEIYRDSIQRLKSKGQLIVGIHADDNPGVFCFNSAEGGTKGLTSISVERSLGELQTNMGCPSKSRNFFFITGRSYCLHQGPLMLISLSLAFRTLLLDRICMEFGFRSRTIPLESA